MGKTESIELTVSYAAIEESFFFEECRRNYRAHIALEKKGFDSAKVNYLHSRMLNFHSFFYYIMLIVFIPQFFARRSNPNKSDILFLSDVQRLHASHLNTSNPVIVYLHGFSESAPGGPGQSSQELRDGKHLQFNTNKQTEQKIAFAELKSIHFFVVFVFIMRYRNVVCVCGDMDHPKSMACHQFIALIIEIFTHFSPPGILLICLPT